MTALVNICTHAKQILKLTIVFSIPGQDYDNNNDDSKMVRKIVINNVRLVSLAIRMMKKMAIKQEG